MKESDIDVGMKAKSALDTGMKVIICVGETMIEHELGMTDEVNARMLSSIAAELTDD